MKHPGLRKGILFFALAILVLSVGIYAYLYMQTENMTADAASNRDALANAEASRLQGNEVLELEASTSERRARLDSLFVPADKAVGVIQAIESVGESSGAAVTISSISAPPGDKASHIGRVTASVTAIGTWRQVTQALALFETLPYDRSVNQLSLRASDAKTWQADFSLAVGTLAQQ